MLNRIGIENKLQFTITLCVLAMLVVTTLGNSGGAPWVFFAYRTLLMVVVLLSAAGCRQAGERIHPMFLAATGVVLALMLVSVLDIRGSQFEGRYFWYKYIFLACGFLGL